MTRTAWLPLVPPLRGNRSSTSGLASTWQFDGRPTHRVGVVLELQLDLLPGVERGIGLDVAVVPGPKEDEHRVDLLAGRQSRIIVVGRGPRNSKSEPGAFSFRRPGGSRMR
jgi:hypothetical protein